MSALLRDQILAAMERPALKDRLIVTPVLDKEQQIGPGSIDLRLGSEFVEVNRSSQEVVDPLQAEARREHLNEREHKTYVPLGQGIVIHPHQFFLGATMEFIGLPLDIVGQVLGRSSWGRLGLLVATAVVVHPGFKGVLTLELVNNGSVPILLRSGSRIAQLQLWGAEAATSTPYSANGKYPAPVGLQNARFTSEHDEARKLLAISKKMNGETTQQSSALR